MVYYRLQVYLTENDKIFIFIQCCNLLTMLNGKKWCNTIRWHSHHHIQSFPTVWHLGVTVPIYLSKLSHEKYHLSPWTTDWSGNIPILVAIIFNKPASITPYQTLRALKKDSTGVQQQRAPSTGSGWCEMTTWSKVAAVPRVSVRRGQSRKAWDILTPHS